METSLLDIDETSLKEAIDEADLGNAAFPTCEYYRIAFERRQGGSVQQEHARIFMVRLCAMRLTEDPSESRFGLTGTDWVDTDFTETQLDELAKIAVKIEDMELRARVCDVLWTRRRKPEFARKAASAYIATAERIAVGGHVDAGSRFRRGMELALTIDKQGDLPGQLVNQIREILLRPNLPDFVVADSVDHLLATGVLDQYAFVGECERRAIVAAKPLAQQRLLDLAYRLAKRLRNDSESSRLLVSLSCSYEKEADEAPMVVLKLRSLKMAIQTLRRGPGNEESRRRLHLKLLEAQEGLPSEFTPVDVGSVDLTENLKMVRERLRGQDKIVALAHLVNASQVQKADRWRENAKKNIQDHPIQNIFAAEKFGSTYKTATSIPPVGTGDEPPEERLIYSMLIEYNCLMGIVCHGTIQPMLQEINQSHYITMIDVMSFVRHSPYIPLGRHEFFCRGLLAGLQGQFIEALHILVPQVEHLIRTMLHENGTVVSGVDQSGHEREYDLNKLLELPEATEFFTDDVVTSLKLLFVHKAGPNLRNEICHGMLHAGQLYTPAAVYGWWLIIWLSLHPVADMVLDRSKSSDAE